MNIGQLMAELRPLTARYRSAGFPTNILRQADSCHWNEVKAPDFAGKLVFVTRSDNNHIHVLGPLLAALGPSQTAFWTTAFKYRDAVAGLVGFPHSGNTLEAGVRDADLLVIDNLHWAEPADLDCLDEALIARAEHPGKATVLLGHPGVQCDMPRAQNVFGHRVTCISWLGEPDDQAVRTARTACI